MRILRILMPMTIFVSCSLSIASCLDRPKESFKAEFKIVSIEKPSISCIADEKNNLLKEEIHIEQKGCILKLAVNNLKQGMLPKIHEETTGKYGIYDTGALCSKKVGSSLTKEIESLGIQCCVMGEKDPRTCSMNPEPKLTVNVTEEFIRCRSKGVGWRIIGK